MDTIYAPEHIKLKPYEELRGELESIEEERDFTYVNLSSGTLRFDSTSREAKICSRELGAAIGERVAILRTQDPKSPIRTKRD